MNIKHYLSALAALSMLAACSDYDPGESGNAIDLTEKEEQIIEEYTENFVKRYGAMDPDHTWGFGVKGSEDEMGTRAVQVERNNWAVAIKENNVVIGVTGAVGTTFLDESANPPVYNYEYTSKQGWIVPGFPSHVDGLYYIEEGGTGVPYTEAEIKNKLQNQQVAPVGDVTDEEIEYVSWWFRSHDQIDSETPPFTEYFVQDISQDFDRESYPNGNWIDYSNGGRQVPVKLYENNQYVRDENPESINYGMDYFSVQTQETDGFVWEHNNNLNKGKGNPIEQNVPQTNYPDTTALRNSTTTFPNRTMKYWTSEGVYHNTNGAAGYKDGTGYTTSFSFHNSNDNTDYEHYVLVHLTFIGPRSGKLYDGYYLGFDYELHKRTELGNNSYKTTDVERDGYYSNWIVKLSPANPEWSDHQWYRVMCEDLGSTDDYDFNDLVFDVYYTGTGSNEDPYLAHIRIQASGGTLPIHIGYNDNDHETHRLLQGDDVEYNASTELYSPINVGYSSIKGVVTAAPKDIVLNMTELIAGKGLDADQATNPDRIPIYVNKFTSDERKAFVLPETDRTDAAPQKICIPGNSVRWMRERKQIEETYTYFPLWVNQENSPYDFGKAQDWTKNGLQKTGNLY